MNERSLHLLEYDKVIQLLNAETSTIVGKNKVNELQPSIDFERVVHLQNETDEARNILRLNKSFPIAHVNDITESLHRSTIGGILNEAECLDVAQVLYIARSLKNFIENLEGNFPLLTRLTDEIVSLRHLEQTIKSTIDEHGEIVDDASPTLKSIRQSIRTNEARVRERLQQITRTKSKMLSDTIVTIRNNRYVLPVKHEYRSAIGGIVHDQSSSGQTLFMEPKAIIEINNQLQQLKTEEKREIDVILRKLTEQIAEFASDIRTNLTIITEIDVIYAKAKLAEKMDATKPILNNDGIINLKQARHPLIPMDEVVANDISLGTDYFAIVITGPNTGGKTVTLKTIGLCTLMAQAGLQIPALEDSKLAVFSSVFADIGDEQSIEQNLSTFSSHMTNIVQIMEEVDEQSLILFDELGAGTDPQEGAALAMSILDEVIERRARVVATTHYPELKAYGYNRPSVMNASVEFDVETLSPTYRLMMGVPGRSNAFEISKRLGLRNSIIDKAKSYLGVDTKNVENMITALENTKKQAEKELEQAHLILQQSKKLHDELKEQWSLFLKKREHLLKEAEKKAEEALLQAREEAEIIVEEVRKMKDQTMWKEHEWIEAKKMLEEAKPELLKKDADMPNEESFTLNVGDEIEHLKLMQIGQVIEKKNNEEYIVQIGMMKVTAKRKDLRYKGKSKEKDPVVVSANIVTSNDPVKPEIDLRGERYEDAMRILEEYIDRAMIQNYPRVTIIHGKGTGALKKGVENFIKQSPYIKSSRIGGEGEGGSGVTIVEL